MAGKIRKSKDERCSELIAATIREVSAAGTLDIPTSQIAKSAGVSPGLVFHYFGDKEALFLAAMRWILSDYATDVRSALKDKTEPQERLEAIIAANFGKTSLRRESIAAWVNFYGLALREANARRLLTLYHRRLRSNLLYDLRPLMGERAEDVALRIGGLIDGLYLRYALDGIQGDIDGGQGAVQVIGMLHAELAVEAKHIT
jgi:TetR/AcrR family transcriptional repressor of bet genes